MPRTKGRKPEGRQAQVTAAMTAFLVQLAFPGTLVDEGTLEQEQGGVFLPGQFLSGDEHHTVIDDLETTLGDQFRQGGSAMCDQVEVEGSVDAGHAPAKAKLPVELFTGPEGDITSRQARASAGQVFPGGGSGEFPEDGVQELTVSDAGRAAVFALMVQQAAQRGEQGFDQAPLVVGEGWSGGVSPCGDCAIRFATRPPG